jgi:hypothetical protein
LRIENANDGDFVYKEKTLLFNRLLNACCLLTGVNKSSGFIVA